MACRLCLSMYDESITKPVKDDNWKSAIPDVLPQLMLDVTDNPVICEECNTKLWLFKAFKDTCFKSENTILSYKSDQLELDVNGCVNIRNVVLKPKQTEEEILRLGWQICRICLQFSTDCHTMGALSTYTMCVKNLFQELDLEMTTAPVICKTCATSSEEHYQFQQMCIHVENTLRDNCLKASTLTYEDFIAIARKMNSEINTSLEPLPIKSELPYDIEVLREGRSTFPKVEIKQEPEEQNTAPISEDDLVKTEVCLSVPNLKAETDNINSHEVVLDLNKPDNNLENYVTVVKDKGGVITYKCFFCAYASKTKRYVKLHIINKHNKGAGSYDCIHCSFKTVWEHLFKLHLSDVHKIGDVFQCGQCSYQARRPDILRRHNRVKHSDSKSYKCQYCGHETKQKISLQMHIKVKHKEDAQQHACPHCEYKTKRHGDLKMHVRCQHDPGSRTYACSHCTYSTRRPSDLNIHWRAKHDAARPLYACPHCPYETRWRDLLRAHVLTRHTHAVPADWMHCCHCRYRTRVRSHLRGHIRLMHGRAEALKCPHCDYTTKVKQYMNRHITWNHTGMSKPYENLREQQRRRREFLQQQQQQLEDAQQSDGDSKPAPIKSQQPPKRLPKPRSKTKTEQCSQCEYRSARKSDLRVHVAAKHDGSVTYPCPLCEYRARWKHSLHVHKRLKHPDTCERFACEAEGCAYEALRRSDLAAHARQAHGHQLETVRCPHCKYNSLSEIYIARHVAQMHAGLLQAEAMGGEGQ